MFNANKEQRGFIREYSHSKSLPLDGVNHLNHITSAFDLPVNRVSTGISARNANIEFSFDIFVHVTRMFNSENM